MSRVVDLFAGAGGWSVALRAMGLRSVGYELDRSAVATAEAAGHHRVRADVATVDPTLIRGVTGVVGSPPCQPFAASGHRHGREDAEVILEAAAAMAAGSDSRAAALAACRDERSALVLEPLRWIQTMQPEWFALEQVVAVTPLWEAFAALLGDLGYDCAVARVSAETYGLAQTRRRALFVGSRVRAVSWPEPTHAAYRWQGRDAKSVLPEPASAGSALGIGEFGTLFTNTQTSGGSKPRGLVRSLALPSFTVDTSAGSWTLSPHRVGPPQAHGAHRAGGRSRSHAPTLQRRTPEQRRQAGERRVTVAQAGALQGFPLDYPWRGPLTEQYRQAGNAIPPILAAAGISAATGRTLPAELVRQQGAGPDSEMAARP